MKLKVNKSEGYNWSIVVDEKELRRLDEIIKKAFNDSKEDAKLEYEIKCSDGSLIETDNIDEVVSEENSKNHQIQRIRVNARYPKLSKVINISFGYKELFEKTVYYSISGDSRDWVYLTASKIEERIKNLKEWYSIIPNIHTFWICYAIFLIALFNLKALPTGVFIKYFSISQDIAVIVMISIIIGISYVAIQLTKKVFPSVALELEMG